jgi:hypothetical protein
MPTATLPAAAVPGPDAGTAGLIGHEARHAVLGVFHEFGIQSVRADWPKPDIPGSCEFNHAGEVWDAMRLAELFITVAGGPVGEKGWPPAWPPSLRHPGSDEYALARLSQLLNLNAQKYFALIGIARDLIQHPAMKAAERALSILLKHANISGREARSIVEISIASYFKELHEQEQPEPPELEAPPEPLQQPAEDEPPEREPLHPDHQAALQANLANLMASLDSDGPPAKGLRTEGGSR